MESLNNVHRNVNTLLNAAAERDTAKNEVAFAVLGKQQEAAKQAGEAVNQLLSQAAEMGRQLSAGRLDVRI